MKKILLALALTIAATSAFAQESKSFEVWGNVVDIESIWIKTQQPVQNCYIENRTTNNNNAAGSALTGMIIGGLLGKGVTGKDDGAIAGAVIGGMVGANNGANNSTVRQVEVCNTEYVTQTVANEVDVIFNVMGNNVPIRMNATQANNYYVGQRVRLRLRLQLLN